MNDKKKIIGGPVGDVFVVEEESIKGWAKRHIIDTEKDEYKLFSGPHGRKIVARLNRHKRAFAIAYASLCVSIGVNIWLLYLYFKS